MDGQCVANTVLVAYPEAEAGHTTTGGQPSSGSNNTREPQNFPMTLDSNQSCEIRHEEMTLVERL